MRNTRKATPVPALALAGSLALFGASPLWAAGGEGHEGGSPSLLSFDPGVSIWALIVFVLLLLILKKAAWKPILDALDARDQQIKDSLSAAEKAQAENARVAEEQAKILSAAKKEAGDLVHSARQAAEEVKKKIEAAAQDEKARILASAQSEIEAEKQAALRELRKTTADLSLSVAEKLIRRNLDDAQNRALVDTLIAEVEKGA